MTTLSKQTTICRSFETVPVMTQALSTVNYQLSIQSRGVADGRLSAEYPGGGGGDCMRPGVPGGAFGPAR